VSSRTARATQRNPVSKKPKKKKKKKKPKKRKLCHKYNISKVMIFNTVRGAFQHNEL
jgi:hypothetical protein